MSQVNTKRLLVRADDMGSSHAANMACIDACLNGIARSVELMVPCPWFAEACQLLSQHPEIDVGIHLTITSEWDGIKWGPLSHAPSLQEAPGQFYPQLYSNQHYPKARALKYQAWCINELETELRAQIELALTHVPHISHISHHMAIDFGDFDASIGHLCKRLSREYGLHIDLQKHGFTYFEGYAYGKLPFEQREQALIEALACMQSGNYFFLDHPALASAEIDAISHKGYENVAEDRYACFKVFTSPKVLAAIAHYGIQLVSYRGLK